MRVIKKVVIDESGQGLVEYSLILSLIAIALISVLMMFGGSVLNLYETIKNDFINSL